MARSAPRIDSAILQRAGELRQVRGQFSRCLRRLRVRAGQEKGFARLTGIVDETDNPVCVASAKAFRGRNVGRRFVPAWPPVSDDLLFTRLIVIEDEVELIFKERGPGVRSGTA